MNIFNIEAITKWVAITGTLSYLLGFVIVNSMLGGIGANGLSLIESQYLTAGILYLFMTAAGGIGWIINAIIVANKFTSKKGGFISTTTTTTTTTSAFTKTKLFFYSISGILAGNLFAFLIYYFVIWKLFFPTKLLNEFDQLVCWWIIINVFAMVLLTMGEQYRYRNNSGLIWSIVGVFFLIGGVTSFGTNVYGKIPSTYGGGLAHRVQIIVNQQQAQLLNKFICVTANHTASPIGVTQQLFLSDFIKLVAVGSDNYIFYVERADNTVLHRIALKKDQVLGIVYSPD